VNIKFVPKDQSWPADKVASTNVGDFKPGQVLSMQDWQESEAKRLISNGDFVESDPADATAVPAPEVEEFAGKKKK
jgi:hypothetical protein